MARIQPPEKAGLLLKLAHRYTRKKVGKTLETAGVMGHHNWILAGNGAFEFALERSKRAPSRLKDLAGMKAAMMIGCPFWIDIGSTVCRADGVREEQLRDLGDYRNSPNFSELEKLVLDLAVAMTRTPAVVGDELVSELRKHLDEAQLVELTASIAWENWRARFNRTMDIASAEFSEGAFCPLPEKSA